MAINPLAGAGFAPGPSGFKAPGIHFEGNKSGNSKQNADAHRALEQALGGRVDKDTQREFHDYITGQGYTTEELYDAAEEFVDHKRHSSRRFSRFA